MADLAASAVTVVRTWTEGGLSGKDRTCRILRIALTGQGDNSTNRILASALGFTRIDSCSNALDYTNQNKIIPAVPNAAGTAVLLCDITNVTDASKEVPATRTGFTIQIEVAGLAS